MVPPSKKMKLAVAVILIDEITYTDFLLSPLNQAMINFQMHNARSINTLTSLVWQLREDHIRMPGYEKWIDLYLETDFYSHLRLCRKTFSELLHEVGWSKARHFPPKQHEGGRVEVSSEKSLLVTLWYIGKGDSLLSISDRFDVTTSTVHVVTSNCFEYLSKSLQKFITWPNVDEKRTIAQGFQNIAGYPGVIGAIDVTHIALKVPITQQDSYINRKFFHSVNLQAVCTAKHVLTYIFTGSPGSAHDSRVFQNSSLFKQVEDLGYKTIFCESYHLIGDSAYPLLPWLMKPYDSSRLTDRELKHNKVLSLTRVVIEHVFGLLENPEVH